MSFKNEPVKISDLLSDEAWLDKFTTYKQKRSILHQVNHHGNLQPVKIVIESDDVQNFITIEYSTGEKITV